MDMAKDTKEKILDKALEMFSKHGYHGTNMRELAAALGLTKAALYKHYKSKEEIWNCMLDNIEQYYSRNFGSVENLPPIPESVNDFIALTMRMVDFTISDARIVSVRKMLVTEQFHDERARTLATRHFNTGVEEMFTEIFKRLMLGRIIRDNDPNILAFSYTAPISELIMLCDREPEKKDEIIEKIRCFVIHFMNEYGVFNGT